jgi:hypothetical protein
MERDEMSVAMQWLSKQISAATDKQATIVELFGTIFSIRSVQSDYKQDFS